MNEVERFEATFRREVLRIVLTAKNEGGDAVEAEAAASGWAAREHRAATRNALKRGNPIHILSRSEKLIELTVRIIEEAILDVYGVPAC